ncbi:unnamed protein product [Rhizoctonia solani]|uniref:Lysine-specific metallo-endopeptidase domain-containing protein n=1 Tax=Rhizoctonia solani TaxID=456999 RepID=A0A8H3DG26_9AGAM|nr:unnamed protein product [Rhizoctonia solani]
MRMFTPAATALSTFVDTSGLADTIIHEGTHFTQVLGTDDYAYGQSACLSLASSNPTNAVYNADNHAFFSVNA